MTSILTQHITLRQLFLFSTIAVMLFFIPSFSYVGATTTATIPDFPVETVDLYINKHISGEDRGFELSDFLYRVVGEGIDAIVSHDTTIPLRPGTYTIEELAPSGFVKTDWRIGWYGQCESGSAYTTSITIEEGDLDHGILYCEADNQYRPEHGDDPDDPDDPDDTNATGTIAVSKVIVGTSTTPEQFSFIVNSGRSIAFENDGENIIEVASGTYAVTEVAATGYAISYSDTCSGTIVGGESVSCVITNTWDDEGGENGGGDDDVDTFMIIGYVWHDDNENTQWDGFQDEEEASTTEEELTGWTVEITNGSTTYSTTTDPTGYYYFEVPAGTWTITEVLEEGWSLITPVAGSFTVTVPEVVAQTFLDKIFAALIPTAHAAVLSTYGPYNFGNNESSGGGGGDDDDDDSSGGGSSSGSSGGGSVGPRCDLIELVSVNGEMQVVWETRYGKELILTENGIQIFTTTDNSVINDGAFVINPSANTEYEIIIHRYSRKDTCAVITDAPSGAVLGDQVAVVPVGAPAAGGGGSAPIPSPHGPFGIMLTALKSVRHGRFG